MADNAQKTWLPLSLNRLGQKKAAEAIQLLGKALPASVAAIPTEGVPIVTVKFEVNAAPFTIPNVTCPLFGPEWIRYPIAVGTKGVVFPADAYLGGVSGLGDGVAQLGQLPGNLSALVFFPIANKGWQASEAPRSLVLYGPEGVIIRDAEKKTTITLTVDGVTIDVQAGKAVTINGALIVRDNLQLGGEIESFAGGGAAYAHDIKTTGGVVAGFGTGDQVGLQTHTHTQGPDSHGDTEAPTAAPTAGS